MRRHSVLPGLIAIVAMLVIAAPTLVRLAQAVVPLVIAGGIVAVVLRVVWWFTNRI